MSDDSRTVQLLIGALREQCLLKGHNGIRGLGLVFRRMDIDFSKGIVYPEFRIAIDRYGLKMSEGYSKTFFNALDKDKSGAIDFAELMNALRSPMNERRTNVVKEAFDNFDVNTDGKLSLDDLRGKYFKNETFILKTTYSIEINVHQVQAVYHQNINVQNIEKKMW